MVRNGAVPLAPSGFEPSATLGRSDSPQAQSDKDRSDWLEAQSDKDRSDWLEAQSDKDRSDWPQAQSDIGAPACRRTAPAANPARL